MLGCEETQMNNTCFNMVSIKTCLPFKYYYLGDVISKEKKNTNF
jgi:hypothetical protein